MKEKKLLKILITAVRYIMHKKNIAIILCGGKGTRLGKNTIKTNKALINYNGKPLIHYIINFLFKNNIDKIIIPYGYKGKDINNYIKKKFKNNRNIICFNAGVNTSREKRLKKSSEFIDINTRNIIILNGDSYYNFSLKKIIKQDNKNTVILICTKIMIKFGFVSKNTKNNKISFNYRATAFNELITSSKKINYFYSGLSIINSNFFFKNIHKVKDSFEEYLFNKAARKKQLRYVFDESKYFQVNTPEDLKNNINEKSN